MCLEELGMLTNYGEVGNNEEEMPPEVPGPLSQTHDCLVELVL